MNTDHDELERLLGEELHDRAGDIGGARLHLGDVRGRATSIRRRRRFAAGIVAAAVMALAVPVGLNLADGTTQNSPPVAPSPDPTPAPTPQADGSFLLTIKGLPTGQPAKIGYTRLDQKQLVMPGKTFDTPEAYQEITPYGTDGWLALRGGDYPPTGHQVVELNADFEVVRAASAGSSLALSSNAGQVAWVELEEGRSVLAIGSTDGSAPMRTDLGDGVAHPVGFLPDDRVVFANTDQATAEQSFGLVAPDGTVTAFSGFLTLNDASDVNGLVAGQTDYRRDGTSCAGVLANSGMAWETCDYTLGRFSPDGRYVVGLANQYDGTGSPTVSILDAATGDPLVDFRPADGTYVGVDQVEWEDEDTILATVTQASEQALLRLDMDGRIELVDGPFRLSELEIKLRFAEHPVG